MTHTDNLVVERHFKGHSISVAKSAGTMAGLLDLSNETLLQIINALPFLFRNEDVMHLSQVCRQLRSYCLPYRYRWLHIWKTTQVNPFILLCDVLRHVSVLDLNLLDLYFDSESDSDTEATDFDPADMIGDIPTLTKLWTDWNRDLEANKQRYLFENVSFGDIKFRTIITLLSANNIEKLALVPPLYETELDHEQSGSLGPLASAIRYAVDISPTYFANLKYVVLKLRNGQDFWEFQALFDMPNIETLNILCWSAGKHIKRGKHASRVKLLRLRACRQTSICLQALLQNFPHLERLDIDPGLRDPDYTFETSTDCASCKSQIAEHVDNIEDLQELGLAMDSTYVSTALLPVRKTLKHLNMRFEGEHNQTFGPLTFLKNLQVLQLSLSTIGFGQRSEVCAQLWSTLPSQVSRLVLTSQVESWPVIAGAFLLGVLERAGDRFTQLRSMEMRVLYCRKDKKQLSPRISQECERAGITFSFKRVRKLYPSESCSADYYFEYDHPLVIADEAARDAALNEDDTD